MIHHEIEGHIGARFPRSLIPCLPRGMPSVECLVFKQTDIVFFGELSYGEGVPSLVWGRNLRLRKEQRDLSRFVRKRNFYEDVIGVFVKDLRSMTWSSACSPARRVFN